MNESFEAKADNVHLICSTERQPRAKKGRVAMSAPWKEDLLGVETLKSGEEQVSSASKSVEDTLSGQLVHVPNGQTSLPNSSILSFALVRRLADLIAYAFVMFMLLRT